MYVLHRGLVVKKGVSLALFQFLLKRDDLNNQLSLNVKTLLFT